MKVEYYKEYSNCLNRDMEYKVYGHAGIPLLVFPAQDGRFFDFENFGMINVIADKIDAGLVQVFCLDSIVYTCQITSSLYKISSLLSNTLYSFI